MCVHTSMCVCVSLSPGSPEGKAIHLAGQAHGGGVNNRHEPLRVGRQHTVEQLLIPVLEPHQKHISGNGRGGGGGEEKGGNL